MYTGGCSGYGQPLFIYYKKHKKRPISGQKYAYRSIIRLVI